jgi:hypothetical protein
MGFLLSVAMAAPMIAQDAVPRNAVSPPTINFTLDFPQSSPDHYSISVDATGHVRYECNGKVANDADEQMYRPEFEISPQNRRNIFEWAKQAQYFSGKIDSGDSKLAFIGAKTLSYQDNEKSYTARYNYSKLEPVRQLTALFQDMAATLEYGRRLAYHYRYQKLALDDELKQMQAQAKSNQLAEIQAVAPILREIAEDSSVMNVVRARAQDLIQISASGH